MHRSLLLLLLVSLLSTSGFARNRVEDPSIPGEAGLRAYRAQKARERMQQRTGAPPPSTSETPSFQGTAPDPGGRKVSGSAAPGGGSLASKRPPADEAIAKPERPAPTPAQLAQLKREAKAQQARRQKAIKPIVFHWPRSAQPALYWTYLERQVDGIGEVYNTLRTPRHTLSGIALEGYQATEEHETGPAGLVLRNAVRRDLILEFYTFRTGAFLPHLEANAVQGYQRALAEQFGEQSVELVEVSEAQNEYGPATADRLTRRIRYRLQSPEKALDPKRNPVEVADYLVPLEREWLVVRFFAPAPLFPAAVEAVEDFLNRLVLEDPSLNTATR